MTRYYCDYCQRKTELKDFCVIEATPQTQGKSIAGFYAFMGRDEVCFDCWKKVALFITDLKRNNETSK